MVTQDPYKSSVDFPDYDPLADETLIDKIIFFFQNAFLGTGDANYERKKLLKQIQKAIRNFDVKVFDVKRDALTPAFAELIFQIYRYTTPLKSLININQDKFTRSKFENYFVEEQLSEEQRNLVRIFDKENLEAIVKESGFKEVDSTINTVFHQLQNSITQELTEQINSTFTCLNDLNDIVQLDLYRTLKKFAPALKENIITEPPKFRVVDGRHLLEDLKDISAVLYSVNFKADFSNTLNIVGRFKGGSILPVKDLRKFIALLENLLTKKYLSHLISYIQRDPYFRPLQNHKTVNLTQIYFKNLTYNIKKRRDEIGRELKNKQIKIKLTELFGTAKIRTLSHYNDVHKEQFLDVKMDYFLYSDSLNYLKYFLMEKYNHYIRETLNHLIVHGIFLKQEEKETFSNSYYPSNETMKAILAFDESLSEEAKIGSAIKSLLKTVFHHQDPASITTLSDLLKETNDEAKKIITDTENRYETIVGILKLIIEDYKNGTKKMIANIRKIAGGENKEFIAKIVNAYNDMGKLTVLLRFMVPK